jgi:hypothetical protein
MTHNTHCPMCKQKLKRGVNTPDLHHPHESYADCLEALANRVKELENGVVWKSD